MFPMCDDEAGGEYQSASDGDSQNPHAQPDIDEYVDFAATFIARVDEHSDNGKEYDEGRHYEDAVHHSRGWRLHRFLRVTRCLSHTGDYYTACGFLQIPRRKQNDPYGRYSVGVVLRKSMLTPACSSLLVSFGVAIRLR